MITNAGGGYSRWNDLAVTRWREDSTCDNWGTFCYIRTLPSGEFWSAAFQPTLEPSDSYEAIFSDARAEFRRRDRGFDMHTEIAVSPEDDIELRRISITNTSRSRKTIEVTSYGGGGTQFGGRRRTAPGVQQSVRSDRDSARPAGDSVYAPAAFAR